MPSDPIGSDMILSRRGFAVGLSAGLALAVASTFTWAQASQGVSKGEVLLAIGAPGAIGKACKGHDRTLRNRVTEAG